MGVADLTLLEPKEADDMLDVDDLFTLSKALGASGKGPVPEAPPSDPPAMEPLLICFHSLFCWNDEEAEKLEALVAAPEPLLPPKVCF